MHEEVWKPIPGFEGEYDVSNLGRVRSLQRMIQTKKGSRPVSARILKPGIASHGYPTVALGGKSYGVNILCLLAFVGPRPGGAVCRHKDGDKLNNALVNLEWASESQNMLDVKWHNAPNGVNRKLRIQDARKIKTFLRAGMAACELAVEYGVSTKTIHLMRRGLRYSDV